MARKAGKSTPVLRDGILHVADEFDGVAIDSQRWREFLETERNFYYDGEDVQFTARHEKRRHGVFWYAVRYRERKLLKRYIGRSEDMTAARLAEVAALFIS